MSGRQSPDSGDTVKVIADGGVLPRSEGAGGRIVGVAVFVIGGLAWLGGVGSQDGPGSTFPPPVPTTTTSTSTPTEADVSVEPPEGTITVSVTGVADAEGWQLAGFLYTGADMSDPGNRAIGGFAARVGSDLFSTTRLVRQPADAGKGPFPYLGHDVLTVRPGTYTLMVWLGSELISYRRSVPADRAGLVGCQTLMEVEAGQTASVTVTGGFGDAGQGPPPCTVNS